MSDPDLALPDLDSLVTVEPPPAPPEPPRRTRAPRRTKRRQPGIGALILLILVVQAVNTAGVVLLWADRPSIAMLVVGWATTDLLIWIGFTMVLGMLPRRG